MNILFVHQNFPGQYKFLASSYNRRPEHRIAYISSRKDNVLPGVLNARYALPEGGERDTGFPPLRRIVDAVHRGSTVATAAEDLKKRGFRPDVICVHPGWGEALFLRDVYPSAMQLHYCEFYFRAFGSSSHFDPKEPVTLTSMADVRNRNLITLFSLVYCDWGITPTRWQYDQHPGEYRHKLSLIHDGIDTRYCSPGQAAGIQLPDGRWLDGSSTEIVTYVARSLEPVRGFPTFMRAAAEICRRRPGCHILVVGDDTTSYGPPAPGGKTYRELLLEEIDLDRERVHFLGRVPYDRFIEIFRLSRAHIYLTVPFVLSWSMLEAMACGCVVVGSRTPPVTEVIRDGENGLLAGFFEPGEVASRVIEALDNPDRMAEIRRRARQTVVDRYELGRCLAAQHALVQSLADGRRPADVLTG